MNKINVSYNKENEFIETRFSCLKRREIFLWQRNDEINLCMHVADGFILDLENPKNHWSGMSQYTFPIKRLGVPTSIEIKFS